MIAHELGHIRQMDLPVTVAIQFLGDLFWFVPGYRRLSRRIDRLREIVADQWAVRSGIQSALLASALVKLKEIPETSDRFILYSAFFREKSLLKTRVEKLVEVDKEKPSRFGWQIPAVRYVVSFWILIGTMASSLAGNHVHVLGEAEMVNQFLNSLKAWGLI